MITSSKELICVFCGKAGFKKQVVVSLFNKEQEVVKCDNCGKFLTRPEFICTNYTDTTIVEDWEYLPKEVPDTTPDVEVDATIDENGDIVINEVREKEKK